MKKIFLLLSGLLLVAGQCYSMEFAEIPATVNYSEGPVDGVFKIISGRLQFVPDDRRISPFLATEYPDFVPHKVKQFFRIELQPSPALSSFSQFEGQEEIAPFYGSVEGKEESSFDPLSSALSLSSSSLSPQAPIAQPKSSWGKGDYALYIGLPAAIASLGIAGYYYWDEIKMLATQYRNAFYDWYYGTNTALPQEKEAFQESIQKLPEPVQELFAQKERDIVAPKEIIEEPIIKEEITTEPVIAPISAPQEAIIDKPPFIEPIPFVSPEQQVEPAIITPRAPSRTPLRQTATRTTQPKTNTRQSTRTSRR